MILSDRDIKQRIDDGDLVIDPFERDNVEPSSVDLRLGQGMEEVKARTRYSIVRTGVDDGPSSLTYNKIGDDSVIIDPGALVLVTTLERIEIPNDLVAKVEGRSSVGRLGVSVHQTAGYIDPGFKGQITLELSNVGPAPIELHTGQRITQIVFEEMTSPAERPYGHEKSQYQNQSGATESGMQFD